VTSAPASNARSADVAVVGAGFSGLAAALELQAAGFDVVVLEARDRVAGRVLNHELAGGDVVEVGGQWVGPTQRALLGVAAEVGVETYPTHTEGDNLIVYRGRVRRYRGTIPRINPAVLIEVERMRRRLNRLCRRVPLEAPWGAAEAARWDRITFSEWMRRNSVTRGARMLITLAVRSVFGTEPEDVSFLHVLFYLHSAGGFDALVDTAGGAQEARFVGGSQLVAIRMAERLGDRVVLDAPVRAIHDEGDGVRLETAAGAFEASRAIVAASPTLAARIDYEPPLPGRRDQMAQRMPQGAIIKCMAVYPEPFWRGQGLSGSGLADGASVNAVFDNTPEPRRDGGPGVLLGFLDGRAARVWGARPAAERRSAVVDVFARLFGPHAASPIDYVERNWAEERWSRGCYSGAFGPSAWTDFGPALRAPIGRVHWAGTETATVWNGYIDGAITAGRRAAGEAAALERPGATPSVISDDPVDR
jgi:monoamine oxidase